MTASSSSFDSTLDPIQRVVNETRKLFESTKPTLEFDRLLGYGAAGVVFRVREPDERASGTSGKPRRYVIKRAIGPEAEAELVNEVMFLKVGFLNGLGTSV
jgi:hypothetical protein